MSFASLLQLARSHTALTMVFAAALIVMAVALRMFTPITLSYATFYPAVILATVAGGWPLGAAAMLISAMCAIYFFVPPTGSFAIERSDIWNVLAFWTVCSLIIAITSQLAASFIKLSERAEKLAEAKAQQHTLLRELSHRMKNQYAVILAMARSTGGSATSVADFQSTFSERLQSLSRAHDLLTQTEWGAVSLFDLIDAELGPFSVAGRLDIRGEDVRLKDAAVVNLGMALHELATNSTKHGAWSGATGRVTVSWMVSGSTFEFRWSETDGQGPAEPVRQGFGRTLLEKVVPAALQGRSSFELCAGGFSWTLVAGTSCLEPAQA